MRVRPLLMKPRTKMAQRVPTYPMMHLMFQVMINVGMCIGVMQSFRNMERTQDRITGFLSRHSRMSRERIEELMLNSTQLVKDVGTLLEGEEAVREGLIDEVGGLSDALGKLHEMIENCRKGQEKP